MEIADKCIGRREIGETKSNHPWLNEEILELISAKHSAAGTEHEVEAVQKCSEAIRIAREEYINRTREELKAMKPQSKQWWNKSGTILGDDAKACAIPALKNESGEWVRTPEGKSQLLAKTMADKYVIRDACENEYSKLQQCQILQELVFPLEETTMNEL